MKITLELPPQVEAQLRQSAVRGDAETLRQLLAETFAPTVEMLIQESPETLTDEGFESLADELADQLALHLGPDTSPLSDNAISRAGIYGDHP